jgi:sucrose-phosphate synthase
MSKPDDGYYIVLISVHGLIRGHDLELGRDADTGGQTLYVLELMRALAKHPDVARVDLLTRRVHDPKVSEDYARPHEQIGSKAHLIRLPCGPRRYLRKEVLWPHLDSFADQALKHIRRVGQVPDVIHGHYADAGYVGVRLSNLLEAPLVFTGHSLGHVKRERLIERGIKPEVIENQYHISQRIEAENMALDNAALVVASTHQEVGVQYSRYDNYQPKRMVVIPPGIDLQRFYPPKRGRFQPEIYYQLKRFLMDTKKPMILAIARPDPRKNLTTLVEAYGRRPELRELANLAIIAGNREELASMEKGPRRVLSELMTLIDRYDLYGHIAYPKHHQSEDVPYLYRIAASTRGVFVNPALTEPFGLTLLEAAASGLPIIATNDGGPQDIIDYCRNGLLIDPLDTDGLGDALLTALSDRRQWRRWSKSGIAGVHRHFSWDGHVVTYLGEIEKVMGMIRRRHGPPPALKSRLPVSDRVLVCDIDNTLIGDEGSLDELLKMIHEAPERIGLGVATGRRIDSAVKVLREWSVPTPDFIISAAGSEIHYGAKLIEDEGWKRHVDYRWEPELVREAMRNIPGLKLQPKEEQRRFKISYFADPVRFPGLRDILRHLRQLDIHASVIYSHQAFFDLLPVRASKGAALRYLADKWGIPLEHILAAGDSGNDEEMLTGQTLGVVVGNHSAEIEKLRGNDRVYFARGHHAAGIIEGIRHYDFLGSREPGMKEGLSRTIAV